MPTWFHIFYLFFTSFSPGMFTSWVERVIVSMDISHMLNCWLPFVFNNILPVLCVLRCRGCNPIHVVYNRFRPVSHHTSAVLLCCSFQILFQTCYIYLGLQPCIHTDKRRNVCVRVFIYNNRTKNINIYIYTYVCMYVHVCMYKYLFVWDTYFWQHATHQGSGWSQGLISLLVFFEGHRILAWMHVFVYVCL